jgi:hypothetical protein
MAVTQLIYYWQHVFRPIAVNTANPLLATCLSSYRCNTANPLLATYPSILSLPTQIIIYWQNTQTK